MENTWKKDYVVAAIMGEGCPGVAAPHFLAVWRSKEVAVHLYIDPPSFYWHADCNSCMLQ